MKGIISQIHTDLDEKSLTISIQNALQSGDAENQLFELLGYANIEAIQQILASRELFANRDIELHENRSDSYYKLLIQQFSECFGVPFKESQYILYKNDYDINSAISQYLGRDLQYFQEEEEEQEQEGDPENMEYVANCVIIDHEKPFKQFLVRQFELDLHGYDVKTAVDVFRQKFTDLVLKVQDGKGNIKFKVITGRGLHSDGLPMIKMHIMGILKRNQIPFLVGQSGGFLQIIVKRGMAGL